MKWKVGDRVMLYKSSQFYLQAPEVAGTIMRRWRDSSTYSDGQWVTVKWDNGYTDGYRTGVDIYHIPKTKYTFVVKRKEPTT